MKFMKVHEIRRRLAKVGSVWTREGLLRLSLRPAKPGSPGTVACVYRSQGESTAGPPLRQAPGVDHLDVETPVAAQMKGRNLMMLQQLVNRAWM
jgi:hypothetical protein